MAEFQWWLLIVGLVAGGGLVAVVSTDSRRREQDISELEQRAEATWIADQLGRRGGPDTATVEDVLRAHRDYLALRPPDRLIVEEDDDLRDFAAPESDRGADPQPDHIRDDGRRRTDEDLAPATEQRAAARQEAHAGPDRE